MILLLLTLCTIPAYAQKEDNVWIFGYDSNTYPEYPGTDRITFDFMDSLVISYSHGGMKQMESNTSICDSTGKLLLLSNGCFIETGDGVTVENSDSLNPGWVYDNFCTGPYGYGYNSNSTMLLLQAPGFPSNYCLFHIQTYISFQPLAGYYNNLLYTKIDMEANNGNGKVMFKNQPLISDTIHSDALAAVRHANGRDWWVVVAKQSSNKYYLILLSPQGITIKTQNIGKPAWSGAGGETVFSPDGTKMARFNTRDDLRIFDFDRCTGELSNPVHIGFVDGEENKLTAGLAWSADGHYLYAAEISRVLQFDAWAADILASRITIAVREFSSDCQLGSSLGYLELGPDGRIYCRPESGQDCMHRIGKPEKSGAASEFVHFYHHFDFSYKGLPHFPNFRLGPVDGSVCDTLGLNNHPLAGWRYDHTSGTGVDFTSVSWYDPELWYWDFDDPVSGILNSSTARNPAHEFSAPGAYEVCLTVSNQYGSDTKCRTVWVSTSSSNELQGGGDLKIYPNPTTGIIYFSDPAVTLVRVFDNIGRLQLQQEVAEDRLDLSHLQPSIYRLQVFRGSQIPEMRSVAISIR